MSTATLWTKLRIPLLAVLFIGLLATLAKSIFDPRTRAVNFTFPSVVPLPGWQPLPSSPLSATAAQSPEPLGRRYRYVQDGLDLSIDMHYLVNTDGDVASLMRSYTSSSAFSAQLDQVQRQQQGMTFYEFTDQQRAYLSACINPRGVSTVTREQFAHNRNTYDLEPKRLLPWVLGQVDLRDWRCLWAHLSISLNNGSPESRYEKLEAVWGYWHHWWNWRFPKY